MSRKVLTDEQFEKPVRSNEVQAAHWRQRGGAKCGAATIRAPRNDPQRAENEKSQKPEIAGHCDYFRDKSSFFNDLKASPRGFEPLLPG